MADKTKQEVADENMNERVTRFDKEFQELQKKFMLRLVAQVVLPGGAILTVPIQAFPIGEMPVEAKAEQAVEAE